MLVPLSHSPSHPSTSHHRLFSRLLRRLPTWSPEFRSAQSLYKSQQVFLKHKLDHITLLLKTIYISYCGLTSSHFLFSMLCFLYPNHSGLSFVPHICISLPQGQCAHYTLCLEHLSQRSSQCLLPLSIWGSASKVTFFTGVLFDYLVYLLLCLAVFLFLALIAILQNTVTCLLILSFLLGYKFHEERDYYLGFHSQFLDFPGT